MKETDSILWFHDSRCSDAEIAAYLYLPVRYVVKVLAVYR